MKKILLSMAAVATLAVAASPAAAQSYDRGRYDNDRGYDAQMHDRYDGRAGELAQRIDRSLRTGQISQREAWRLRGDLREARMIERAYWRDGRLNHWERVQLDRRYDEVAMGLRHERNDRDYGAGYGRDWRR
jgi:hypothetical protein